MPRPPFIRSGIVVLAWIAGAASAGAQPAPDDDDEGAEASGTEGGQGFRAVDAPPEVQWGIGPRLRLVHVPKAAIELFFEEVPSGLLAPGFGLDVTRRKGNFEINLGVEYESLAPDDGFYREKGGDDSLANISAKTDFSEFDGFAWVTVDATFVFHTSLSPLIALRYGAGFGLGVILGEIYQTDSMCTSADIQEDCVRDVNGAQVNDPADLPPVFPVVNLLGGLQIRPSDRLAINVEVGMRTLLYAGIGASYFF